MITLNKWPSKFGLIYNWEIQWLQERLKVNNFEKHRISDSPWEIKYNKAMNSGSACSVLVLRVVSKMQRKFTDNSHKRHFSLRCLSTDFEHI